MTSTEDERSSGGDSGQSMMLQISNAMVRMQKEFFGKGPTKAKSYMFDDLLLVVMREGMTTAEKTMLQFGHPKQVREFRQLFQDEMTEQLTNMVQDLTRRRVVNYQSQVLFDPDMTLEIFVFQSEADGSAVTATAFAQIDDDEDVGTEGSSAPTEQPAESGQDEQ